MVPKEEFITTLIPSILEKIEKEPDEVLEENERRSTIRIATMDGYKAIEQNKKKESRFGRLATTHHVVWIIDEGASRIWYLTVDGEWYPKASVTDDGALSPDAVPVKLAS